MDKNYIMLFYYNYLMKDYSDKNKILADGINIDEETGAFMEWRFDFKKCLDDQITVIKEKSTDFILETYNKNSEGYKIIHPSATEMIVYIFFKDSSHLKDSLDRPRFLDLRAVVKERYQLYIERCGIKVDSVSFEDPQRLAGTFRRRLVFSIINFFVIYFVISSEDKPFKYTVVAIWCVLVLVAEQIFNRKYTLTQKYKGCAKKSFAKIVLSIILAIALVVCGLFVSGNIGVSEKKIVSDIRKMQYIDGDWLIEGSVVDDMAAYICYPEDKSDYTFSVYLNHPGMSFGYFFRYGGAHPRIEEGVLELEPQVDKYKAHAYISMNTQQIEKLKIDNGTDIEVIDIDSNKPFAIVLPTGIGVINFYDIDGNVVECVKETM